MKTRSQKAQRILNVLQKIHTIEELKKLELQRKLKELENSQHEVIHALNTDDALHGLFVDTAARFLQSLAKEADQVARARDIQAAKLLENAGKFIHIDRFIDTFTEEERRAANEKQLMDVIDSHTRKPNASPR